MLVWICSLVYINTLNTNKQQLCRKTIYVNIKTTLYCFGKHFEFFIIFVGVMLPLILMYIKLAVLMSCFDYHMACMRGMMMDVFAV